MKAMKLSRITVAVMTAWMAISAMADDAEVFRRNVSSTALQETEYAGLRMLNFYVPAQSSDETLVTGLPYVVPGTYDIAAPVDPSNTAVFKTRDEAKPLVAVYNDGYVAGVDGTAFAGHGQREAYVAVSLDDGATWKRTNLSKSAAKSSFTVTTPVTLYDGTVTTAYPGDVVTVFHATAKNKILVAWQSRYCKTGFPAYVLIPSDDTDYTAVVNGVTYTDIFGVRGAQKSVNYATADFKMDDFDRAVGEVPFNCLWTARGTMYTKDGQTGVVWTQPERLTSGVRDVNRIEVASTDPLEGGFVVTWQEDPDGLLPGSGEGSGEGWAGATANHQTDIWYSYIKYADFSKIDLDTDNIPEPVDIDLNNLPATAPRPGVLFKIPVRLTDNAMCKPTGSDPYCYADLNNNGTPDFCATTTTFDQGSSGSPDPIEVCVTEDGRVLNGQTAATRARTVVKAATDGTKTVSWVAVAYEDSKGLGEITDSLGDEAEAGKNARFMSFKMDGVDRQHVIKQGLQLNPPSNYWNEDWATPYLGTGSTVTPEGYQIFDTALTFGSPLYDTEIARRTSIMTQPISQAIAASKRISYVALFKQGIINQGGPADIMLRRWQLPTTFDPLTQNPFNPRYMLCKNPDGSSAWKYTNANNGGANPNYIDGLCLAPATNMSGTIPEVCESGSGGTAADCLFQTADAMDQSLFPKTVKWDQTVTQLTDPSWYNAYDIAKGHRGFLDGDFIMVMYAWSPNWKQLADGNDHYNLYTRRSFTGGNKWTTTPATLGGDGTTTCENYLDGTYECTAYAAGAFERARNVSQLLPLADTVLDPRYTPTPVTSPASDLVGFDIVAGTAYEDDTRDRSKFFVAFESGDATYVGTEGEPHPWDMFDSRAYNWGDDYYLVANTNGTVGFDGLEIWEEKYSGEAALTTNPAGTYMYAIWNQWEYDTGLPEADSETINSDAIFRKVLFLYPTLTTDTRTGTGTNPIGPGVTE